MIKPRLSFFVLLITIVSSAYSHAAQEAYYRSPDLHEQNLVFTSQGDLWLSQLNSNALAKRLTSHASVEMDAKFSPSGNSIAFVASYQNIPAVHIIPTNGGLAKQVSFEYGRTNLLGWLDEQHILISTNADTGMHSSWVLKRVNVNDLSTEILPLSDAIDGTIDTQANIVFFVQHGLQVSTDNANHYKGGAAGELWRFNLNSESSDNEATWLTQEHQGSVHSPMLFNKQRLYFISNENNIDNIWSMNVEGGDIKQHTKFDDWAVRDPSIHGNRIVFQHGADIKIFDINTESVSDTNIAIQSDFVGLRTQYIKQPMRFFESASLANTGDNAVVTARGNLALVNTKDKRLVNIPTDQTARMRSAVLSSDGKTVYAISDQTGDYEIWAFDALGKNSAKQLTKGGSVLKTRLWVSPDGKTLAYTEKNGGVFLLNLKTEKVNAVSPDLLYNVANVRFSLDSRYLAITFTKKTETRTQLFLYDIKSKDSAVLTSAKYDAYSPAFSDDLSWLYFLSDRAFSASPSSPWGDRNMGAAFDKRTLIFAMPLTANAKFPFSAPTELDLVKKEDDKKSDKKNKKAKPVKIDFDKLKRAQWQLELPASNYSQLLANEHGLFVLDDDELKSLKFEYDAKLETMTKDVTALSLSSKFNHMLVQKGNSERTQLIAIPAKPDYPSKIKDHELNVSNWTLDVNPKNEWQQIFKDAWLMHRDSLFDANMRGLDWQASKQKYLPLLARVTERSELNDIFEQMMGELNALHSQVRGGDISSDPNAPVLAILGASYKDTSNGILIETIFEHDPEILDQAPPLAHPSVNAQEGDLILAVNNQKVSKIAELKQALYNTQGRQVLLSLKRGKQTIETIVVPTNVFRINRFRHQHWVMQNLKKVTKANNDIGYLHLYAMGGNDLASFARDFYAQYEKKGLIIDVRRNRGGNIDSIVIEKLLRRAWSFWENPQGDRYTNMQNAFRGHLVVLADQFTYSDGETFTAGIKALELGTVIGKQTAGAGVWLSGQNRLVDGGIARVAEFPVFAMDGRWITEGRGISPHIEVTNLPHATYNGQDAQLQAAIEYLENKLRAEPIQELKALPFPNVESAADDIIKK